MGLINIFNNIYEINSGKPNVYNMSEAEAKHVVSRQGSVVKNDAQRFTDGVIVKGKLFAVKKEHKQKLSIKINLEGIEIMDESNSTMFKHSVNRISYIARDLKDPRAIGYIYKNIDDSYQYFGLRTEKQAQEFFNLLKDLFEVVLELRTNKKKKESSGNNE